MSLMDAALAIRQHWPKAYWLSPDKLRRIEIGEIDEDKADPVMITALATTYGRRIGEISPLIEQRVEWVMGLLHDGVVNDQDTPARTDRYPYIANDLPECRVARPRGAPRRGKGGSAHPVGPRPRLTEDRCSAPVQRAKGHVPSVVGSRAGRARPIRRPKRPGGLTRPIRRSGQTTEQSSETGRPASLPRVAARAAVRTRDDHGVRRVCRAVR
jgi:hypothetical protein